MQDLVARGNASATSDKANLLHTKHVVFANLKVTSAQVGKSTIRTRHEHLLADLHPFHMLTHDTTFREFRMNILPVDFNEEIYIAFLSDLANRSVLSLNFFLLAIDLGTENHMLSDWQTKDLVFLLKIEPEDVSIISDLDFLRKRKSNTIIFILLHLLQGTTFLWNFEWVDMRADFIS